MNAFLQYRTRVVAVCDVIAQRREEAKKAVDEHYGAQDCRTFIDWRELIAQPDIDAVMIATGDNNHSLISVHAACAGKDIYCETAQRHHSRKQGRGRCGAGTAVSSSAAPNAAMLATSFLPANWPFPARSERSTRSMPRRPGGCPPQFKVLPAQPTPKYEEMAWDLWLGGAAWRPYNDQYPTGFWRSHGDFSGGSITEWGSHTVDMCQWALNADNTSALTYEAINPQGDVQATYADGTKLILKTGLRFGSCPVRFEGEEGWVETGDDNIIETYPASLASGRHFSGGYPADNHVREFLNCMKTRQQPRSTAESAHRSITTCHCANIAIRLGRPVRWDPVAEEFPGDEAANRLAYRALREPFAV